MATAVAVSRETILGTGPSKQEILRRVEEEAVKFINLQFTDVMGIVKSVTIPAHIFGHVIDGGQWIDGSSIAGFTRIAESDMYLEPDLSTFTIIPWERGEFTTARVVCWVYGPNGDPSPATRACRRPTSAGSSGRSPEACTPATRRCWWAFSRS